MNYVFLSGGTGNIHEGRVASSSIDGTVHASAVVEIPDWNQWGDVKLRKFSSGSQTLDWEVTVPTNQFLLQQVQLKENFNVYVSPTGDKIFVWAYNYNQQGFDYFIYTNLNAPTPTLSKQGFIYDQFSSLSEFKKGGVVSEDFTTAVFSSEKRIQIVDISSPTNDILYGDFDFVLGYNGETININADGSRVVYSGRNQPKLFVRERQGNNYVETMQLDASSWASNIFALDAARTGDRVAYGYLRFENPRPLGVSAIDLTTGQETMNYEVIVPYGQHTTTISDISMSNDGTRFAVGYIGTGTFGISEPQTSDIKAFRYNIDNPIQEFFGAGGANGIEMMPNGQGIAANIDWGYNGQLPEVAFYDLV